MSHAISVRNISTIVKFAPLSSFSVFYANFNHPAIKTTISYLYLTFNVRSGRLILRFICLIIWLDISDLENQDLALNVGSLNTIFYTTRVSFILMLNRFIIGSMKKRSVRQIDRQNIETPKLWTVHLFPFLAFSSSRECIIQDFSDMWLKLNFLICRFESLYISLAFYI